MKLNKELKENIDKYFENISAGELYDVLTQEFNMPVCETIQTGVIEYESQEKTISSSFGCSVSYSSYFKEENQYKSLGTDSIKEHKANYTDNDPNNNLPFAA